MKSKFRYSIINFFSNLNVRGADRAAKIASSLLMPVPKSRIIVETIHGFKIHVDPVLDNGVERNLYRYGTYEKGTLKIMELFLKKGDVFVDAGANIGLMTVFAALIVGENGKVLSFEANPVTKRLLDENIQLNGATNAISFGFGLGSKPSTATLYSNLSFNRGSASLFKLDDKSEEYIVNIKRLDSVPDANVAITMIKIDVEGWELEVLKGCGTILSGLNAPALIVECNSETSRDEGGIQALYNYIKSVNNYRIFKPTRGKGKISKLKEVERADELPQEDNLFCFLPFQLESLRDRWIVS